MEGRVMLHYLEIQGRKKIRASEGTSRVTALNTVDHPDDVPPDLCGNILEWVHAAVLWPQMYSKSVLPALLTGYFCVGTHQIGINL
jgi:hypothetical protein